MSLVASTGPFVQPLRLSTWLKHEYALDLCREDAELLAGSGGVRSVVSGQVLGVVPTGAQTVTVTAKAGNVGNGAIASATADAKVPDGRWEVLIIEVGANAGKFEVRNPKGKLDGSGTVGTAYIGGINFTWADDATDMGAGDAYFIDLAYAPGEAYLALDLTATDGSQYAAAIAIHDASAADGVAGRVLILNGGPSAVDPVGLTWPADITASQKAKALRELRDVGIRATPA